MTSTGDLLRGILLVLSIVIAACAGPGFALPTPAPGPPSGKTPHPVDPLVTVEGDQDTDTNEITPSCVFLYLWAEVEEGPHWQLVAMNRTLLDAGGRDTEGRNIFCDTAGHFGPRTYRIPLWKVPAGWYIACTGDGCGQPFQHDG